MNRTDLWLRSALLLVITVLMLAGCGGNDDTPTATRDSGGTNRGSELLDPCNLVPVSKIEASIGKLRSKPQSAAVSFGDGDSSCSYTGNGEGYAVVSIHQTAGMSASSKRLYGNAKAFYDKDKTAFGGTALDGLGQESFTSRLKTSTLVNNDVYISISVNNPVNGTDGKHERDLMESAIQATSN